MMIATAAAPTRPGIQTSCVLGRDEHGADAQREQRQAAEGDRRVDRRRSASGASRAERGAAEADGTRSRARRGR